MLVLGVHAGRNRALLGKHKAHEAVLAAMRAHAGVAEVQAEACVVLSSMAHDNGELHARKPLETIVDSKTVMDKCAHGVW